MWSARPFTRIVLIFILGIIVTTKTSIFFGRIHDFIPIIILILVVLGVVIYESNISHKYGWIYGTILGMAIFLLGIFVTTNRLSNNKVVCKCSEEYHRGEVISNPVANKKFIKALLTIDAKIHDNCNSSTSFKVIAYIRRDIYSEKILYGDAILFKASLLTPEGPKNPFEFDYGKYLMGNGIHHICYIDSTRWKIVGNSSQLSPRAYGHKLQYKLLKTLKGIGIQGDNYDVAAAVLLGYGDTMSKELKQDFANAGAMHILCVSGLHVGIIYLVLNFILSFFNQTMVSRIQKAVILILFVWIYAIITGLSASITRATLMISVFIIGNLFRRDRDTYNTLAASAFIILLINPMSLFDVGFQLSYAAVLGILIFYRPLYELVSFKYTIADKLWSVTILSISAQLSTFPLAVYYFHIFPTWFWLTNILTFPLSFLIIVTGIIFLAVSWIPIISVLVGKCLLLFVFLLNQVVDFVQYLPWHVMENIFFSSAMVISIYFAITLAYFMLFEKKIRALIPLLLFLITISSLSLHRSINIQTQKRLIIYHIKRNSLIEFISGDKQIMISDSNTINNPSNINYQIKNSRSNWGIAQNLLMADINASDYISGINITGNYILFDSLKIFITNNLPKISLYDTISVDILVISGKSGKEISTLIKNISFEKLVIDNNIPPWERKRIIQLCEENNYPFHNVNTDGALVVEL